MRDATHDQRASHEAAAATDRLTAERVWEVDRAGAI